VSADDPNARLRMREWRAANPGRYKSYSRARNTARGMMREKYRDEWEAEVERLRADDSLAGRGRHHFHAKADTLLRQRHPETWKVLLAAAKAASA